MDYMLQEAFNGYVLTEMADDGNEIFVFGTFEELVDFLAFEFGIEDKDSEEYEEDEEENEDD